MFQVTNEFTRDELTVMRRALSSYLDEFDGGDLEEEVQEAREVRGKIDRLLLLGRRVRFTHEGEELTGTLDRLETALDGSERAVVIRKGFGYRVSPDDVLGPVE